MARVPPVSDRVAIVVPVLNEEKALPAFIAHIAALDPPPAEVIVVDGGSRDSSCDLVREAGWACVSTEAGRGRQINAGIEAAGAPFICVLHAMSSNAKPASSL